MCAIKNCKFFEQAVLVERYQLCAKNRLQIDKDGFIHVPTKPGIGVELTGTK